MGHLALFSFLLTTALKRLYLIKDQNVQNFLVEYFWPNYRDPNDDQKQNLYFFGLQ